LVTTSRSNCKNLAPSADVLDPAETSLYGSVRVKRLAVLIATVGGIGWAPVAPGTLGSLVAVPLLVALGALRVRAPVTYVVALGALFAVAIWAAGRAEETLGGEDHSAIVIDEVAGMVVAGAFLPGTWLAAGIAFGLFRVLDVLKPFPANVFDEQWEGGIGVVGDDLVAGAYAGVVSRLLLGLL
jgi:phosphatidylglycerophosphatase A